MIEVHTKGRAAGLVPAAAFYPRLVVDLRYAGSRNFFGRALYDRAEAWLLEGAARKLAAAAQAVAAAGYGLALLDAYRPLRVQAAMWEILPDGDFVAPPERGSSHNRGAAVDVTLLGADGSPVPMPSEFDEFSERASHAYEGGPAAALEARRFLRTCMEAAGFVAYEAEWWHYVDPEGRGRPLLDLSFDELAEPAGPAELAELAGPADGAAGGVYGR